MRPRDREVFAAVRLAPGEAVVAAVPVSPNSRTMLDRERARVDAVNDGMSTMELRGANRTVRRLSSVVDAASSAAVLGPTNTVASAALYNTGDPTPTPLRPLTESRPERAWTMDSGDDSTDELPWEADETLLAKLGCVDNIEGRAVIPPTLRAGDVLTPARALDGPDVTAAAEARAPAPQKRSLRGVEAIGDTGRFCLPGLANEAPVSFDGTVPG